MRSPLLSTQGHIEMSICDTGGSNGVPTQECFNKYPLDRAMSDGDASPIDSNYPGRYYVDPPCRGEKGEVDQDFYKEDLRDVGTTTPYRMFARFRLPDGLTCSRCILQAKYCELSFIFFSILGWPRGAVNSTVLQIGFSAVGLAWVFRAGMKQSSRLHRLCRELVQHIFVVVAREPNTNYQIIDNHHRQTFC